VSIETGCGLGSIPDGIKRFFLLHSPPIHLFNGSFSGAKRLWYEANLSPQASAGVKNCEAVPPQHHTYSWRSAYFILTSCVSLTPAS
jgi:hypothetical protein